MSGMGPHPSRASGTEEVALVRQYPINEPIGKVKRVLENEDGGAGE